MSDVDRKKSSRINVLRVIHIVALWILFHFDVQELKWFKHERIIIPVENHYRIIESELDQPSYRDRLKFENWSSSFEIIISGD